MIGNKKGRGRIEFDNGDEYYGDIVNGEAHGHGTYTYSDGNVYVGEWEYDKMNGLGTIYFADGGVYQGAWKDGKAHGYGSATWPDGTVYEGQWKSNKKHGSGTLTSVDGSVYEGGWENGKKNGNGTYTHANGDVYEGEWKLGKMHGNFTFKASGDVYKQVYEDGNRVANTPCATLSNCPPTKRARTGEVSDVVLLDNDHKECGICLTAFSTKLNSDIEEVKRHLPVLSKCDHCYCHGCVLAQQEALAEQNSGEIPEHIPCMKCRKVGAFCPSRPRYHKFLIDLLEQSIPVVEG